MAEKKTKAKIVPCTLQVSPKSNLWERMEQDLNGLRTALNMQSTLIAEMQKGLLELRKNQPITPAAE